MSLACVLLVYLLPSLSVWLSLMQALFCVTLTVSFGFRSSFLFLFLLLSRLTIGENLGMRLKSNLESADNCLLSLASRVCEDCGGSRIVRSLVALFVKISALSRLLTFSALSCLSFSRSSAPFMWACVSIEIPENDLRLDDLRPNVICFEKVPSCPVTCDVSSDSASCNRLEFLIKGLWHSGGATADPYSSK